MIGYVVRKSIGCAVVLALASAAVFAALYVLPGDPAQVMLGINATADTLAALRHQLGLDQPLWRQYLDWIASLVAGPAPLSFTYRVPVTRLLADAAAVTVPLAALSLVLTVIIAVPAGIFAALRRQRPVDLGIMALSQLGLAIAEFWLAMLMILAFAVKMGWFPAGGFAGWQQGVAPALRSLCLPALSLALVRAAAVCRMTRSAMIEVLDEDFIRYARAKGLGPLRVVLGHGLRCALIPIVTVVGLQAGQLVAGVVIIENVFHLPGIGRLAYQAIGQRDLPVVGTAVLFMAAAVVVLNYLTDLACRWSDPRLRSQRAEP